jgi:preprotein translocase subunit YajC
VSSEQLGSLVPLVLIVAAAYLLLIRPARKRAQDVNNLQRSLTVGADVMLTSGIFGSVVGIDDDKVGVQVADGVVLTVHRGAIAKVVSEVSEVASYEDGYDDDAASTDDTSDSAAAPDADDSSDPDSRGAH